jgi:hypothetical protein
MPFQEVLIPWNSGVESGDSKQQRNVTYE